MRTLTRLAISAASVLLMSATAMAQTTATEPETDIPTEAAPGDPAPGIPTDVEVLGWDDLPESIRQELEPLLGRTPPQAVLNVDAAVTPDPEARIVDHGDILTTQTVRPAAIATLVQPTRNQRKYGPAGAALWAAVGPEGDYWCWRDQERHQRRPASSNIYCYRDADNDGRFDQLMENNRVGHGLPQSSFQFTSLGRDERMRGEVTYAAAEGHGDLQEIVAIRYDGPAFGRVAPDGRVIGGIAEFSLITGPGSGRLDRVRTLGVRLDESGQGRLEDGAGLTIEVERVNVDGTASVRVVSALPAGRALLFPPFSQDDALEMLRQIIFGGGILPR